MAEVKWIKIVTDIFDDEKMLLIESLPDADSLIVIWFKLLCLAGKNNNDGVFLMNDRIPYTEEMLSTIFRRNINTVRFALNTFEQFGMIEIINGVITIPNWGKHQTLDSYEKKKERDKLYQAERRAKQKQLTEKSSDASSDTSSDKSSDVAISDIDKDKNRKDKEEEKRINTTCAEVDKPPTPQEPVFIRIPLIDKTEFDVTESMVSEFKSAYPAVDVEQQLRSMRQWSISNPKNKKTRSGVMRFINNWLMKDQNKAGSTRQSVSRNADDEWAARKDGLR